MKCKQAQNIFTKLLGGLWKLWHRPRVIHPVGVEVEVMEIDNEPHRCLSHVICCPRCGKKYCTDSMGFLCCTCGFKASIDYNKDIKIVGLQDTINHLNVRINYMLTEGANKEKLLLFLAEMRELTDALEFGTTLTELKVQEWKNSGLDLKHEIMYSLR